MARIKDLEIELINHDSVKIKGEDKVIYIDPFHLPDNIIEKADFILITHDHYDHLSLDDIRKITDENTVIIASQECLDELSALDIEDIIILSPWDQTEVKDIKFEAVPAYNINKFKEHGEVFHPKEDNKNGYIITIDGKRVYHTGDTDFIPEMRGETHRQIYNVDIALVPVSGTYVMTADEAADAVNTIKPDVAIPMHYGDIVGSREDAEKFATMVTESDVEILL